jgi:hypothetical protein
MLYLPRRNVIFNQGMSNLDAFGCVNRLRVMFCLAVIILFLTGCTEKPRGKNSFNINTENFEVAVEWRIKDDNGSNPGTFFELWDENGKLIGGAGLNNGVNTQRTTNRQSLSFFLTNNDSILKNQWIDMGNPFPQSNIWNRIFSYKNKLYTFGEDNNNTSLKYFDTDKNTWNKAPIKQPNESSVLIDVFTFNNQLIWVYSNSIYFGNNLIFHEPSARHRVNAIGFNKGRFFIYSNALNDSLKNKIYFGEVKRNKDALLLDTKHEFTGLCENPSTCFIYGWAGRKDGFLLNTNFGHVYELDENGLRFVYRKEDTDESWQLYGMITVGDSVYSGHYPSGNVYIINQNSVYPMKSPVPVPEGATSAYREAQTFAVYGGHLYCGVWPWGELWAWDFNNDVWEWAGRAFEYPAINEEDAPFVNRLMFNKEKYDNHWGQRIIGLVASDSSLYINTAFKNVINDSLRSFLLPKEIEQYGKIYKLYTPGQISTEITIKPETRLVFRIKNRRMSIEQDGIELIASKLPDDFKFSGRKAKIKTDGGIYGKFILGEKAIRINGKKSK